MRQKIVREKEALIDEYYHQLDMQRQAFLQKKGMYTYYLRNTATGDVYTNLVTDEEDPSHLFLQQEDWYYVHSFYPGKAGYLYTGDRYPSLSNFDLYVSPYRDGVAQFTVSYDQQELLSANWKGGT